MAPPARSVHRSLVVLLSGGAGAGARVLGVMFLSGLLSFVFIFRTQSERNNVK